MITSIENGWFGYILFQWANGGGRRYLSITREVILLGEAFHVLILVAVQRMVYTKGEALKWVNFGIADFTLPNFIHILPPGFQKGCEWAILIDRLFWHVFLDTKTQLGW
jgi:hypothetical protein